MLCFPKLLRIVVSHGLIGDIQECAEPPCAVLSERRLYPSKVIPMLFAVGDAYCL